MPLPHVNTGSPHVAAHNAERDAINDLEENKADKSAVSGDLDALTTEIGKKATNTRVDAVEDDVDSLHLTKADKSDTYTKTEVDAKDAVKADKSDTYTKSQVDAKDSAIYQGTSLGDVDLDTVKTRGLYFQTSNSTAAEPSRHYPRGVAGLLEVLPLNTGGNVLMQRYTPNSTVYAGSYTRVLIFATQLWSEWYYSPDASVTNTVGFPGTSVAIKHPVSSEEIQLETISTSADTTDLNLLLTPGKYRQSTGANATLARNYPMVSGVWSIEVIATGGGRIQRATRHWGGGEGQNPGATWTRAYHGSSSGWGPWRLYSSVEVSSEEIKVWDPVANVHRSLKTNPALGVVLGEVDLNTITTPGVYRQISSSLGSSALNYPRGAGTGILRVWATWGGSGLIQEFTPHVPQGTNDGVWGHVTYRRVLNTTVWSSWRAFTSQRINTSPSQPGPQIFTWDDANNREQELMGSGIVLGTIDLNQITHNGVYIQPTGGNATPARNYPGVVRGTLEVSRQAGTQVIQKYTPQMWTQGVPGPSGFWIRSLDGTTWSPWRHYASQRVDNTAGRAIYTWDDTQSREQLIYGDTGWREVKALVSLYESVNPDTSTFRVCRVGSEVHLEIILYAVGTSLGAVGNHFTVATHDGSALPVGFRPVNGSASIIRGVGGDGGSNLCHFQIHGISGSQFLGIRPIHIVNSVRIFANWRTSDPWPTSLPGTPVGSIPHN